MEKNINEVIEVTKDKVIFDKEFYFNEIIPSILDSSFNEFKLQNALENIYFKFSINRELFNTVRLRKFEEDIFDILDDYLGGLEDE